MKLRGPQPETNHFFDASENLRVVYFLCRLSLVGIEFPYLSHSTNFVWTLEHGSWTEVLAHVQLTKALEMGGLLPAVTALSATQRLCNS